MGGGWPETHRRLTKVVAALGMKLLQKMWEKFLGKWEDAWANVDGLDLTKSYDLNV